MSILKSWIQALIDPPRERYKRAVNYFRGVKDISPQQAHTLIGRGAFVLDVREPHEFSQGHLRDATLIPVGSIPSRATELESHRDRAIVVICHGGKRSATACWHLAQLGFPKTYNIAGGILAWRRAQLPLAD